MTRYSVADYARRYGQLGLALVPLKPGQKMPYAAQWQQPGNQLREPEEIAAHYATHLTDGIGAHLSESGLVSLDLDAPEEARIALKAVGIDLDAIIAGAPVVRGRPERLRVMFSAPTDVELSHHKLVWPAQTGAKALTVLELRAGPVQDVLPPSVHPITGKPYEWATPPRDGIFPQLPRVLYELWRAWPSLSVSLQAACPWEPAPTETRQSRANGDARGHASVIDSWRRAHSIESLLAQHGYSPDGHGRYRPPGSTHEAGVVLLDDGAYLWSHHASDPLHCNRRLDSFDTWRVLVHGRDAHQLNDDSDALRDDVAEAAKSLGLNLSVDAPMPAGRVGEWPAPLEDAAFHGIAGSVVELVYEHSEADKAALLTQFLVAVGNAIGHGPYFATEADRQHTNVFAVLVGDTASGRKGTSWSQVARPLCDAVPDWMPCNVKGALSSGEGLIHAVRDRVTQTDENGDDKVVDCGVVDKRLMVVQPEFALVLKQAVRPGNILSEIVRCAWDHGDLGTLTKQCPSKATGAHVSLVGHVTRDELLRVLTETDAANGFGNRMLWICSRRSKLLPDGSPVPKEPIRRLVDKLRDAIEWAQQQGELHRDEEARAIWHSVYPELVTGSAGLLGAITGRGAPLVVRLSCIYALLDRSATVRAEHMNAALAVWQYAYDSARYVFGDRLGDPIADTILDALRSAGSVGLSRTEISRLFNGNRAAVQIQTALQLLGDQQLIRTTIEKGDGPPTTRVHTT